MTVGDFDYIVEETLKPYLLRTPSEIEVGVASVDSSRQVLVLDSMPYSSDDDYPGLIVEFGDPRLFRVIKLADVSDKEIGFRDPLAPFITDITSVTLKTTPLAGAGFYYGAGPIGERRLVMTQSGFRETSTAIGADYGSSSHEMIGTLWVEHDTATVDEARKQPSSAAGAHRVFRQMVHQVHTILTQLAVPGICRRIYTPDVRFYTVKSEKVTVRRAEIVLSLTTEV